MSVVDLRSLPVSSRRQSGVTLVEVLITLIVVAVGLLGMVGMQSVAMKNAQGSQHHTMASVLAYDALERVRVAMDGRALSGNVPTAVLSDVAEIYEDERFANKFPGNLTVALAADNNDVVVTVTWLDDRLGIDTGEGDVETNANRVQVRTRLQ